MTLAVAKQPTKGGSNERRGPGRPPTGIDTDSFGCRASLKLIEAFRLLAKTVGTKNKGSELLRAAEAHIVAMYWIIKDDPDSKLLNAQHIDPFLAAAEDYFKEAGHWPLKRESS
jgi:hypothetical protein